MGRLPVQPRLRRERHRLGTSVDGISWTAPQRVRFPRSPGLDWFVPGIAVAPGTSGARAQLGVAAYAVTRAYGCRDCDTVNAFAITSPDGGRTWTPARRLNTEPMQVLWMADTAVGRMLADYVSVSFAAGGPLPWSRSPRDPGSASTDRPSSQRVPRCPRIGATAGEPASRRPGGFAARRTHTSRVRVYPSRAMAVLIATGLRKEFSGDPLFDGVSFTLRRGDRLALAGPNGAGKTTLLRALVGETSLQAGELAFAKDVRIALHDQRPPRGRGLTLREYALSGASDLVAIEEELRGLEQAMAGGAHDAATLRRYGDATARLEHAGGWDWRDRAASVLRGLGFRDAELDRPLDTFSGGELTRASLARSLAGDPDLLLLDEPTNHLDVQSLEWLERELSGLDAGVILVAHDRWFLEAVTTAVLELGGPTAVLLRRALARVAPQGGSRVRGRDDGRPRERRHRAARAVRGPVPLQEVEGEAGAGEADPDRSAREAAPNRGR